MANFYIKKADGGKEFFQDKKLLGSLLKSRLDKPTASKIAREIKTQVGPGTSTNEIRKRTFSMLCAKKLPQAQLYNLRVALADIPPKLFERYIKKLLEADNYRCEWERIVRGAGTSHEIDVIALKRPDWFLIECKHRGNWQKLSGLGKVLQVQARFEDIKEGNEQGKNNYKFTRAWIINNAKFSNHAKEYARYKGVWLTGWGYPKGMGLAEWIQHLEFYPVTLLRIPRKSINRLLSVDVLTFKDVRELMNARVERALGRDMYQRVLGQIKRIKQCG